MSNQKHSALPLKCAVITAGPLAFPAIACLHGRGILGGVVLARKQQGERNGADVDARFAEELARMQLPCLVLHRHSTESLIDELMSWEVNVGLTIGVGDILPRELIEAFEYGAYNLHASALPRYRGAMPLYWQIRNQETETALTLHHLTADIDDGDIVIQQKLPIKPADTLYSLAAQVANAAPAALESLLELIRRARGKPEGRAQSGDTSEAPWPQYQDTVVNWSGMTAAQIAALSRAGNPAFGAALFLRGQPSSLLQASVVEHPGFGVPPGTVLHIGEPEGLVVAAAGGALRLEVLSNADGIFDGIRFAEHCGLDAGTAFEAPAPA